MSKRIGIVGAGQLGAYLCRAAKELGFTTTVLASSGDDVATSVADAMIPGSPGDLDALGKLASQVDVITFELEDVPVDALDHLDELAGTHNTFIAPSPTIMRLLQNKARQKAWLADNGLPTSSFLVFDDGIQHDKAVAKLGRKYVIKTQRGGYDGYGVRIVESENDARDFESIPCIAEAFVENMQEIAALVARDRRGQIAVYPMFGARFNEDGNILRQVVCPAEIDAGIANRARQFAQQIVDRLDGVGVFAIEMFLTGSELLVNEISPRVHNVGHLTIEAHSASQFEQHIRAVSGEDLAAIETAQPAAMTNLLYEPALQAWCSRGPEILLHEPDVNVHWYGKREPRPLRKMGHITAVADSIASAARAADHALDQLRTS